MCRMVTREMLPGMKRQHCLPVWMMLERQRRQDSSLKNVMMTDLQNVRVISFQDVRMLMDVNLAVQLV